MTMQTEKEPNGAWPEAAAESARLEAERTHPPRRFTEMLPVMLTATELLEKAKRASGARQRVSELEAKKKAAADHWKAQIELAENDRDANLDAISSGIEDREVEVVETYDFRSGSVSVTRADTGEKIRERAMTSAERQPDLFAGDDQMSLAETRAVHDDEPPPDSEGVIVDPDAVLGDQAEESKPKRSRRRSS